MKNKIKHYLKNSPFVFNVVVKAIYFYLIFSYYTSKRRFILCDGFDEDRFNNEDGLFVALWHNKLALAYSISIFKNYKNTWGLASPHSDGKIISELLSIVNYKIIEGSTNKNASLAVKKIITQITTGAKIFITPDGPRGPRCENNSIVTKIANKYNKKIIPVSCAASRYFELNSWDKMILPKPFSKIIILLGKPLALSGNDENDHILLKEELNNLELKAHALLFT